MEVITNLYTYTRNDPINWIDVTGLAPSWAGMTGGVLMGVGGLVWFAGNPLLGAGIFAVGAGLVLWDWATTPVEQLEDVEKRFLEPIKENLRGIEDLLEKEEGGGGKTEGACP